MKNNCIPKKTIGIAISLWFLLLSCEDKEPATVSNIDPAAVSIDVSVVRTSRSGGTATLTGNMKNIGEDYRSRPGQQKIVLMAISAAGTSGDVVAELEFTDLDAGETLELTYETPWSTNLEFPPSYAFLISYDPDILLDANPQNDDANFDNNRMECSGEEINAAFDALPE